MPTIRVGPESGFQSAPKFGVARCLDAKCDANSRVLQNGAKLTTSRIKDYNYLNVRYIIIIDHFRMGFFFFFFFLNRSKLFEFKIEQRSLVQMI